MNLTGSILATLAYHDIFDYPLTQEEIHRFLITKKATVGQVSATLRNLVKFKKIGERRGFFFLRGRVHIIATRQKRQKYSKLKLKRSALYANLLKLIPTIKLVAISGALAMENSSKDDDIDFVIITSPHLLWTTRFLANLLLWPFKRSPLLNTSKVADSSNEALAKLRWTPSRWPLRKSVADRACLNLFIDSQELKIAPQNLYLAHEICQMKPIWDRNQTYSQFIKTNSWTLKFLPNWTSAIPLRHPRPSLPNHSLTTSLSHPREGEDLKSKNKSIVSGQLSIVERILRSFQLWYMRSKITTERIGDTQLFFHPQNREKWVLSEYQQRLKKLPD